MKQEKITDFVNDPAAIKLARPDENQYLYQENEKIMFLHLSPGTWQGNDWDDGSTSLDEINPEKLDTDQWCRAAKSWGAKTILYVAKHVGGFCWWQTETTPYSIKNTPYQDGKGDVLDDLIASCKKHGLKMGIYIYPADRPYWTPKVAGGGKTIEPAKQEAYNKIFRQQYVEVLSRFSDDKEMLNELWFDGGCIIPLEDIIKEYAPNAVILQGPNSTVRWCGTESGKLGYPAWNSLSKKVLDDSYGTQIHGDPDGDAWAPLEADLPLLTHYWLWSKENEKSRKSLNELLEIYYKSVGRGGVMLLNAAPNTDGLIPEADMELYQQLGEELQKREKFIKETNGAGDSFSLEFDKPTQINQFTIMEDYRYGERIREYQVDVKDANGEWHQVNSGSSVGHKRVVRFETIEATAVSLKITSNVGMPLVRSFQVHFIEGDNANFEFPEDNISFQDNNENDWQLCAVIELAHKREQTIDITDFIGIPAQYALKIEGDGTDFEVDELIMYYNEDRVMSERITHVGGEIHNINHTAATSDEYRITLKIRFLNNKGVDLNSAKIFIKNALA